MRVPLFIRRFKQIAVAVAGCHFLGNLRFHCRMRFYKKSTFFSLITICRFPHNGIFYSNDSGGAQMKKSPFMNEY